MFAMICFSPPNVCIFNGWGYHRSPSFTLIMTCSLPQVLNVKLNVPFSHSLALLFNLPIKRADDFIGHRSSLSEATIVSTVQCDQMAIFVVQFLTIDKNDNLHNGRKQF